MSFDVRSLFTELYQSLTIFDKSEEEKSAFWFSDVKPILMQSQRPIRRKEIPLRTNENPEEKQPKC